MVYSDAVKAYFFHPSRIGELNHHKKEVGSAIAYAKYYAACIQLYIAIENGHVTDSAVKVKGCPDTIACACFLADTIVHLPVNELNRCTANAISSALHLPDAKYYAALLAEDSLNMAIKNYQQKNEVLS
jgi:iron-sulfur cluster assembly enzyme ISCU, mitochondrial